LIDFLKNNLSIKLGCGYEENEYTVELLLNNEKISSDIITIG